MTTIRMRVLFAAALGAATPAVSFAQTVAPAPDGPAIDETEGKAGTQSGPEVSPQGQQPADATGSTNAAPGESVDQDTQSEDTGLQRQEGQPGTQSGTPPLADQREPYRALNR